MKAGLLERVYPAYRRAVGWSLGHKAVVLLLAVVLLFTFVIRLIGVDGHSMVPTLQDGDRLLVLNACWTTTMGTATSWCCGRTPFWRSPS